MAAELKSQARRYFLLGLIATLFALAGMHSASAQTDDVGDVGAKAGGATYVEFLIGDVIWSQRKWGHVSLRVVTKGEDFIFDFGRYGKMDGYKKSEGDPILRIWQPGTNQTYRVSHLKDGGTTRRYRFASSEARNAKILSYFARMTPGNNLRNKGTFKFVIARVNEGASNPKMRRFQAVLVNCTTIAVDGFMAGFPEMDLRDNHYAIARDLNVFIKSKGKREDLGYQNGHWSRVWWPLDLMALLDEQYVARGIAKVSPL